jgi:hypothetical protein
MNCLTICQPYAHLIVTPQERLPAGHVQKKIENRSWMTGYRGPLLIHAGRSTTWLDTYPGVNDLGPLVMGQIIGVAYMADSVPINWESIPTTGDRIMRLPTAVSSLYPWLRTHVHAEGPVGFVLLGGRAFANPIPLRGQQGLFDVVDQATLDLVREQITKTGFKCEGLEDALGLQPARKKVRS